MELKEIISEAVAKALRNYDSIYNKKTDFDLIDFKEACKLTGYSKHTLYQMTSRHEIPFLKRPGGRKIFFSKKALQEWIITGEK